MTAIEELRQRFKVEIADGSYRPRFNAAPSQDLLVIPQKSPHKASLYRWGLVPGWAKDPKIGNQLINARAETVADKPAFRTPFEKHRCLVLSDGFYEWDKKPAHHVPYRVILKEQEPFVFAGLCDYWKDETGKEIQSFTIITTEANSLVAKIHDRMPVILPRDAEEKWLDAGLDLKKAQSMLKAYPSGEMEMYPVSTIVNNPKNDMAAVLKPANYE